MTPDDALLWDSLPMQKRALVRKFICAMRDRTVRITTSCSVGFADCAFCEKHARCYLVGGKARCSECRRQHQRGGAA